MKYYEVTFLFSSSDEDAVSEEAISSGVAADLLSALLAEVGFEAFENSGSELHAWVQQSSFSDEKTALAIGELPLSGVSVTYSVAPAPDENWNRQWEQEGFHPIVIPDVEDSSRTLICVHDTRHTDFPSALYDICINPCQAFGTGSHQTTRMILRQLLHLPLHNASVVDAGTGTGILAILCHKLGASHVLAYDIDEWSVRNAESNLCLNNISSGVTILHGDSSVLTDFYVSSGYFGESVQSVSLPARCEPPSLIVANINRNILLADLPVFADSLSDGGTLLLSGFYMSDIPHLLSRAAELGLTLVGQTTDVSPSDTDDIHEEESALPYTDQWALLILTKAKQSCPLTKLHIS